jgi:hypothetical protein
MNTKRSSQNERTKAILLLSGSKLPEEAVKEAAEGRQSTAAEGKD